MKQRGSTEQPVFSLRLFRGVLNPLGTVVVVTNSWGTLLQLSMKPTGYVFFKSVQVQLVMAVAATLVS